MAIRLSRLLACLSVASIVLLTQSVLLRAQSPGPQHPLDGLTSAEYWAVHDILHQERTHDAGYGCLHAGAA